MWGFNPCASILRSAVSTFRTSPLFQSGFSTSQTAVNAFKSDNFINRGRGLSSWNLTFSSLSTSSLFGKSTSLLQGCAPPLVDTVRSIMRIHFPRPRENKRLLKHGWNTRMKTAAGRRILMQRILKNRHSLSHDWIGPEKARKY